MTTVFISYSWDSKLHKERIRQFVIYLRKHKIKVIFDGDALPGERVIDFMEHGICTSDYILMCYTPKYKEKADRRLRNNKSNDVDNEYSIITANTYDKNRQHKFVPVLFEGTWESSMPYWDVSEFGVDLSGDNRVTEMDRLVKALDAGKTDNLSPIITNKRAKQKLMKNCVSAIAFIATISTIIALLFGDNLLGRLFEKDESVPPSAPESPKDEKELESDSSLDELLDELWKNSGYVSSTYIQNLINTGIRQYNKGDFSYAGALFEQAIKEGDEGITAKNNLSFMMRRQEYVSETYNLSDLLEQCKEHGGAFATINYAMYLVSVGEWEEADAHFKMIENSDSELEECINWWESLYSRGDGEGSLVLGWLKKYGLYKNSDTSAVDFFEDAKEYYEDMPDFLFNI